MEKILFINGSPNGEKSNSRKIAKAFLDGLNRKKTYEIEEIICAKLHLEHCRGCFACWKTKEGTCVMKDDMEEAIQKYRNADIIVWSFPNHSYGMPSIAKNFLDRLLPLNLPFLDKKPGGRTLHPSRYPMKTKAVFLFCTAGYYNQEHNMDAIKMQFDLLYPGKYKMIFCTQGQLMNVKYLKYRTSKYLNILYKAGIEFEQTGELSEETLRNANKPYIAYDDYVELVNMHWVVRDKTMSDEEWKRQEFIAFMRCMTLTYEPEELKVERAVLEFYVKEYDYTCQMILDKQMCKIIEAQDAFETYDLKIDTTYEFLANGMDKDIGLDKSNRQIAEKSCFYPFSALVNKLKPAQKKKEIHIG